MHINLVVYRFFLGVLVRWSEIIMSGLRCSVVFGWGMDLCLMNYA